jgi:hypothetical protein
MTRHTQNNRGFWLLCIACIGLFTGCHSTQPLTSTAPTADGWRTIAAEGGGFAFSMPDAPKKEVEEIDTSFGPAVSKKYSLKQGKVLFSVSCTEYPADRIAPSDAEGLLLKAVEQLRKNPGATFLSEKTITWNESHGRDLVINIPKDNTRMCQRFYMVKNRMYTMTLEYPQTQDFSKEATRFLDSLRVN